LKTSEFRQFLRAASQHELRFILPDGKTIAAHAHITEVGHTTRRFLDCGGTLRNVSSCTLQTWVAEDFDHRLLPGSLETILGKADLVLHTDELDVEVEHEHGLLSQFPIVRSDTKDGLLHFYLGTKHTDCLAKEICMPAEENEEACCSTGGGCC
jgi:hypothetical protein